MSKGSGSTRTVNAANAAASRTYAQSAIGGGNVKTIKGGESTETKIAKALEDKYIVDINNVNQIFREVFGNDAVGDVKSGMFDGEDGIYNKFFMFKDKKSGKEIQINVDSNHNWKGVNFSYFIDNKKYKLLHEDNLIPQVYGKSLGENLKELFKQLKIK